MVSFVKFDDYAPEATLLEARTRYFEDNGFGADGGYEDAWVDFKLGPVPFPFPNTKARVRRRETREKRCSPVSIRGSLSRRFDEPRVPQGLPEHEDPHAQTHRFGISVARRRDAGSRRGR